MLTLPSASWSWAIYYFLENAVKKSFIIMIFALLASSVFAADKLTFGELQTIRALAGQTVGSAMIYPFEVKKLGILSNRSAICSTLVGAIAGTYAAIKPDFGLEIESIATLEEVELAVNRVATQEVIYLAFSGNMTAQENLPLLKAVLMNLVAQNWQGTLVIHITTWAQGLVQKIAEEESMIANYLKQTKMRTVKLDLPRGQGIMMDVVYDGIDFQTKENARVRLPMRLVELFSRM